jgi:hypothetical protein
MIIIGIIITELLVHYYPADPRFRTTLPRPAIVCCCVDDNRPKHLDFEELISLGPRRPGMLFYFIKKMFECEEKTISPGPCRPAQAAAARGRAGLARPRGGCGQNASKIKIFNTKRKKAIISL